MPRSACILTATHKSCFTRPLRWPPFIVSNWWNRRSKRSSSRPWEARPMRNLLLVARREYLEQIRGRAFRVSTILVPLLFAIIIGIAYLSGRDSGVGKHVVIAAPSPGLADAVREEMVKDKNAKTTVDVVAPASAADRTALIQKVQSKAVDGLLWIETSGGAAKATYTSQSSGDIVISSRLASALNHALAIDRMTARGMSQ